MLAGAVEEVRTMNLLNDRQMVISVGQTRKDMNWKPQALTISELYERLRTPARGMETIAQYAKLAKRQQDDLKDVGGFVGGALSGGRRKANAVIGRDIVTLDFDTIPAYGTENVIQAFEGLGCSFCVYSTRKHVETAPRLRVLLPLSRTVTPDEYEAIARRVASMIGIQMADPTTFEPSRLMYWPSCSLDSSYVYHYADKPLANADSLLATYTNWRDWNEWPQVPGAAVKYQKLAVQQVDPETKSGIVGAFCRTYDIYRAIAELLPRIYAPVDNSPDRFTYLGGSTTGGAIVYGDGKFLFSHHATDPCSEQLVNAFDLVRLHKFGQMDDDSVPGTPSNRLPSYNAMCDFASADSAVNALMAKERAEQAVKDFDGITASSAGTAAEDDTEWQQRLQYTQNGSVKGTIDNCVIILDNDPLLKGKFALNEFAGRGEVLGVLPWPTQLDRHYWTDTDNNGLYWFMEKYYGITKRGNIDAALLLHSQKHAFNEVRDYLDSLEWDGTPRLGNLLIDYLGAEDSDYTKAVTRKTFVAAVARAMEPGTKFDNMLILCGPQGIGKSTLLDRMSKGWFNDSIRTFEGKDASELLPGVWIVEVAELDAFRRTDVSRIKQFLSLRSDRYRAAYGRHVSELPRRCVFFGTCNQMEFLQDDTGNRRFWPVDVGIQPREKMVWKDLTPDVVDQIWAEAKALLPWEPLFLSGNIEAAAVVKQEEHRSIDPREGMIREFVESKIPEDWANWTIDRRRDFWSQSAHGNIKLVERKRICAIEIWVELFNKARVDFSAGCKDSREINSILSGLDGWERQNGMAVPQYGKQRGFRKADAADR